MRNRLNNDTIRAEQGTSRCADHAVQHNDLSLALHCDLYARLVIVVEGVERGGCGLGLRVIQTKMPPMIPRYAV
jgi:hypothetical protein